MFFGDNKNNPPKTTTTQQQSHAYPELSITKWTFIIEKELISLVGLSASQQEQTWYSRALCTELQLGRKVRILFYLPSKLLCTNSHRLLKARECPERHEDKYLRKQCALAFWISRNFDVPVPHQRVNGFQWYIKKLSLKFKANTAFTSLNENCLIFVFSKKCLDLQSVLHFSALFSCSFQIPSATFSILLSSKDSMQTYKFAEAL